MINIDELKVLLEEWLETLDGGEDSFCTSHYSMAQYLLIDPEGLYGSYGKSFLVWLKERKSKKD